MIYTIIIIKILIDDRTIFVVLETKDMYHCKNLMHEKIITFLGRSPILMKVCILVEHDAVTKSSMGR